MITGFGALPVLVLTVLALALPVAAVWVTVKVLQGVAWGVGGVLTLVGKVVKRVLHFARSEVVDTLHLAGGLVTGGIITPLALGNLAIGRWSASKHYGRALEDELTSAAISLYRIALGNPARFLGLSPITDGVERRIPDLVARAPRVERRHAEKKGGFEGYKVTGTLPAGGSGARLFLARPKDGKVKELLARGHPDPGQVVIKSFDLDFGSTLPQIVRESRALEAAGRLGLVLEHDLTEDSFHYVMPYVPGDDLDTVTRRLHARSRHDGLEKRSVQRVIGYGSDLLLTLDRFHRGGLWHKDIKPSNLIVSGDRVHLVDLGLVTPLASAMTLTTHGTEYFRDPELVRLAMKGVKVHEVDGVKFDLYSAGAVLFSMVENSFPAHGSLSRITKPCPEALGWIIRRAMADMNTRYSSAREMAMDLEKLLAVKDPYAVLPAELPSVAGGALEFTPRSVFDEEELPNYATAAAASFVGSDDSEPPFADAARVPDTDLRVRRRSRRRVMGAATMMLLCGVSTAAALALVREHRHSTDRWAQASTTVDAYSSRGRAGRVDVSHPRNRPQTEAPDPWSKRLSVLPATRASEAGDAGTVLILEDLPFADEPEVLGGLRSALEEMGYAVYGWGTTAADADREVDLLAGARHAVGLGDITNVESLSRVQRWLDDRDDVDAIFWLEPSDHEGSLRFRALLHRDYERDAMETIDYGVSRGQ